MKLTRTLNDFLTDPEHEFKFPRSRSGSIYISSLSTTVDDPVMGPSVVGACNRAEWYRLTGLRQDVLPDSPDARRKIEFGDPIADWLLDKLSQAGIHVVAREYPVEIPDLGIRGRMDGLLKDEDGDYWILEVKTTRYPGSKETVTPNSKGRVFPKTEHALQVLGYYKATGIRRIKLVYIALDSGAMAEHDIYVTDDEELSCDGQLLGINWEDVQSRAMALRQHILEDTEPPRDYELEYNLGRLEFMYKHGLMNKTDTKRFERFQKNRGKSTPPSLGDWRCRFCRFRVHCYRAGAPA